MTGSYAGPPGLPPSAAPLVLGVVVDGPNYCHLCKALDVRPGIREFIEWLRASLEVWCGADLQLGRLVWSSPAPSGPAGAGLARFLAAVSRMGFDVRTAPRGHDDDVVTSAILGLAHEHHVVALVSGDGDFVEPVISARDSGAVVVVVTADCPPEFLSSVALRFAADARLDFADMMEARLVA